MSSTIPEVIPLQSADSVKPVDDIPSVELAPAKRTQTAPGASNFLFPFVRFLFGWLYRWVIGAFFCMFNPFPFLAYFNIPSIFVTGWLYRWMQTVAVKSWWKRSQFTKDGTFRQWCEAKGSDAPPIRPRWILRENIRETRDPAKYGKRKPSARRHFFRQISIPWFSLWENFRIGFLGLFCTFLLTGWGCVLMYFAWIYGWHVSHNKIYEEAFYGLRFYHLGILFFGLAMLYCIMAQTHQAVTGEARAFFNFKVVWNLIRVRPTTYALLAMLFPLLSFPLGALRFLPAFLPFGTNPELGNLEVLGWFLLYMFACSFFLLFPFLLVTRFLCAKLYAGALLKALRKARISRDELPRKLVNRLEDLEMMPVPVAAKRGIQTDAAWFLGWCYRKGVYFAMFMTWWIWLCYPAAVWEFLNRHPFKGFVNQPLIQAPSFDFVPGHLWQRAMSDPYGKADTYRAPQVLGPSHLIAQGLGAQALAPIGGPMAATAQILVASKRTELDSLALAQEKSQ